MEDRRRQGLEMEGQALAFLQACGQYRILGRNYQWRGGEIDLILEEERGDGHLELVFVEVRSRSKEGWVEAIQTVNFRKQLRIKKSIQHFLCHYRGGSQRLRFDILTWDGSKWEHWVDQWLP